MRPNHITIRPDNIADAIAAVWGPHLGPLTVETVMRKLILEGAAYSVGSATPTNLREWSIAALRADDRFEPTAGGWKKRLGR